MTDKLKAPDMPDDEPAVCPPTDGSPVPEPAHTPVSEAVETIAGQQLGRASVGRRLWKAILLALLIFGLIGGLVGLLVVGIFIGTREGVPDAVGIGIILVGMLLVLVGVNYWILLPLRESNAGVQPAPPPRTHSAMLSATQEVRQTLEAIDTFLRAEERRIAEAEETVRKLEEQRAELEPVVQLTRKQAEALLRFHTARQERSQIRSARKERLMAFGLGFVASLVASGVFSLLTATG